MKITLTIQTDNAAFAGIAGLEVERILIEAADQLEGWEGVEPVEFPLLDVNGNKVGEVKTTGRAVRG